MTHVKEIREMDNDALLKEIDNLKKEMFDLRFKHATGQLENTARLSTVRKTIARMKTIMSERESK
ncbi:MAG: 50S ribosomal protein L29 [Candidatus Izemoplasmatales bacterium]|jgi:large subunit ribosomal protein L29|nr:50S ribosomal protein L29 [Candidatus Izemoplasmatales bacterium]NLF48434.1 50S ribosomal protein L29 [Acholeplasmataceae bacterium]MDD4354570.1 50S ribosomal protein L29 [Candidatus Izemoplasmatales bacterium]MDD4988038.1 50S ribosomal protein L29 [Candidatus Izemoplasmatales bacterium]MDD5602293.1 50S ribosomal protein L29 [Candidatus Izemoplasmatales bacterium]